MVHLEPSDLQDAYRDSETYAREFHEPYDEFDRLAKNQINPKIDKTMPRVNDGSLAALVKEVPKRVLAQMSTGLVKPCHTDEEWLKELINIIWSTRIVPNANSQMTIFDKYRLWLYRAVVYGGAPAYSFFDGSKKDPSSDFILPDPRSVFLEDGKVSDLDSDYVWMDVYYKKNQIKSLIKSAKEDKDTTWMVDVIGELLNQVETEKDADKQSSTERDHAQRPKGYKLAACFQRGHLAPFYMTAPTLEHKVARKWANEDPTGNLPITYMYNDQDLENPYGLSQIALSGPTQNVLDYLTQSFLLATQIGLQPPIKIGGDTSKLQSSSLLIAPRQKWRIGDAQVDVVQTNNSTYTQYPQNYGLVKTQLMNMQGTTDATVGSDSGNPGYSKTDAGVNLQKERTNANDNFLRQNAAGAFQRVSQSMINLHVANSEGSEVLKLYGDDLEKMQRTGLIDTDPNTQEPSTDEVEIIWDNMRGEYQFEVDANSSIAKNDEEELESLRLIGTQAAQDPMFIPSLQQSGFQLNLGELNKQIIIKSGVDNWEKILQPISKDDQMAMEQEQLAQAQMGEQAAQAEQPDGEQPVAEASVAEESPIEEMPIEEVPVTETEQPIEQPQDPGAAQLAEVLAEISEQYQVDENDAMAILDARSQGIAEEDIVAYLTQEREA